ncbi:MAG: hypothetical protein Kow0073_07000 [Immundisolibacter sp.]
MKPGARPGRAWVATLLGIAVGLLAGRLVDGLWRAPVQPSAEVERLVALRQENAQLRQLQLIDRRALTVLRGQLAELNARNADLERRFDLLRGVLLPQGRRPELGVGEVTLNRQSGDIAYRLMLVRVVASSQAPLLVGRVSLWALGEGAEEASSRLLLAEQPLSLRRLQVVSGSGTLPADFVPRRLRVVLEPSGQAKSRFEFPWHESASTVATSTP